MKNRSRIAFLIGALFLLGTGSITAYQALSHTIAIVDDGKVNQYETLDVSVGDVLESQGIVLGENDTVTPSIETELEDGTKIVINRWYPVVALTVDGETTTLKVKEDTVATFLASRGILLTQDTACSVPATTKITDGLAVEVKTTEVTVETVEEVMPFETETHYTTELAAGVVEVVTQGIDGKKEKTMEIVRFGGEIASETIQNETVLIAPQTEVVREGIQNTIVDPSTGKRYVYTKELTLEATAYTDIPGDRWEGITASGMPTFVGMVAVDPKVIPLGTILYVEDYGIAIANDVGGAIKGYDIDLFMNTSKEVYNFGRRNKQVYILEDQTIDVRAERAK